MAAGLLLPNPMLQRFKIPISWGELFKRTLKEAWSDDVLNLAAQQAYYFFFALFPAMLALISFASFFPIQNLTDEIVNLLGRVAPAEMMTLVREQLLKISGDRAGGLLTFAFVVTLWSSSGAVLSLTSTLNTAYDVTEGRPWWKVRLVALGLTVGLAFFILTSMTLVIAGPTLAQKVAEMAGLGSAFLWVWNILQWPVVFALVATAIALVYYFAPDVVQEWTWITPGSVLATLLWVIVSLGVRFYVANFGSYTETYGVIGAVMVLMLWFYASGIAILVGAELNAEIEHASPYGKDVGEKIPGEKKKIGALAQRAYEEKLKKGEISPRPFADDENCDIDRDLPTPEKPRLRASDALIGAAALLPAAVTLSKALKKTLKGSIPDATQKRDAA
jgi:membrane protein